MVVCNCSMFCCTLLYVRKRVKIRNRYNQFVHSSFAIILMGKRELVALLSLSSWCLVVIVWLFIRVPWVCLQFVIVVFPDHTLLLLLNLFCAKDFQNLNSMANGVRTLYPISNQCVFHNL